MDIQRSEATREVQIKEKEKAIVDLKSTVTQFIIIQIYIILYKQSYSRVKLSIYFMW